jgi:hypothetical protein
MVCCLGPVHGPRCSRTTLSARTIGLDKPADGASTMTVMKPEPRGGVAFTFATGQGWLFATTNIPWSAAPLLGGLLDRSPR